MRQKEDLNFARALNNLSTGSLTKNDIDTIKSRIRNSVEKIPHDAIHLV